MKLDIKFSLHQIQKFDPKDQRAKDQEQPKIGHQGYLISFLFRIRTQFRAFPKNCHFSPSDQILVFGVRKICAKFHAFWDFISKRKFNIKEIQKYSEKKYKKFVFI